MGSTLISEYDAPDLNDPVPQPDIFSAHSSARLGPYHVPLGVEVSGWHQGGCAFSFVYANEEEPEASPRKLLGQREIQLGSRSRKVLMLRVENPIPLLTGRRSLFSPEEADVWIAELPLDRQFVCQRNAEVVAGVLAAMPDSVRLEILRELGVDAPAT